MSGTIEEGSFHFFRLGRFGKNDLISFLALDVGVQIDDFDAHFQIVQQRHNLNLVCFLIHLLNFELAEDLHRQFVLDEGLVENRIVLQLSRSQETHHEDQVV